jgi:catechol 2,3-dioxygenase-like lactoylglutathione lyase family enzyme
MVAREGADGAAAGPGFRIPMMFHPSHDVFDLDAAEEWYERVFGCKSVPLSAMSPPSSGTEGKGKYPRNYATFTVMRDVVFDTIDPSRYVFNGAQQLPSIDEAHLRMIVWYVDEMDQAYRTLRQNGIRIMNQVNEIVDGDSAPESYASKMTLMFTVPDDAGMRYGLFPSSMELPIDPRTKPGWNLSSSQDANPLGWDRCSHHTVLTDAPQRAVRFHELLGAKAIHEGRNEALGASSTFVHLADSTIEIAAPDAGTEAHRDWMKRAPHDTYHSVTWKVKDLEQAAQHLQQQGVGIRFRSDDMLITDPATSLGIPWGFTTRFVDGDPRAASRF